MRIISEDRGLGVVVGLGAYCPEGSRYNGEACECYPGRVWMPDGSKCVSPQAPSYSGANSSAISGEYDTQQELSASARAYLQNAGHTVDCKVDSENWFFGPQGGKPMRLCSIDGGPYIHAAALINTNPYNALVSSGNASSVSNLVSKFGGSFSAETGPTGGTPTGNNMDVSGETFFEEYLPEEVSEILGGELIDGIPNWALIAGGMAIVGGIYYANR